MPNAGQDSVRPPAGNGSTVGIERFTLLKAAFSHVQQSIRDGRHLEAIAVLESILTDRLGSMVHGALGHKVTLRHTLSGLVKLAKMGPLNSRYAPMPADILEFLDGPLSAWWRKRNMALHGMAKIHHVLDATFDERYAKLPEVVLEGVRVLQRLDEYDQREKWKNGELRSATWPDALRMDTDIENRVMQAAVAPPGT